MKRTLLNFMKMVLIVLIIAPFYLKAQIAPDAKDASDITQASFKANWAHTSAVQGYKLWVATDNNFSSIVSGYNGIDVGYTTFFNVTGNLNIDTKYYYRLKAYLLQGESGYSNTVTLRTGPPNPTALSATNIAQTSATANWNSLTNAVNYEITVATNSSFTAGVSTYITEGSASYNLGSLTANTQYWYKIKACNTYGGVSGYSNIISFTTLPNAPAAPTAKSATQIAQTSFTANWNAADGAGGYYIDVAADTFFTNIISGYDNFNVGNVTSCSVGGLSARTDYFYRVRGFNGSGVSGNSNTIKLTTLHNPPTAPVAEAAGSIEKTSFTANWSASADAEGYSFDVAYDNLFTNILTAYNDVKVGNINAYNVTGLNPNTPYYYRIRAFNTGGISDYSNIISLTTLPNAPLEPIAIAATNILQTSFNANWNLLQGAEGYLLDVSTDVGFVSFLTGFNGRNVGNAATYEITGLLPNTTYYYRVRAYNSGGIGNNSNAIYLTTLPNAPLKPIAIAATNILQTSFNANWNLLQGAEGYLLDVSTDVGFASFLTGFNGRNVGNVATFEVTGLMSNTAYYYRVRGFNAGGEGSNSNVITATTLTDIPAAPVALAASIIDNTSFSANWNASSGEVFGYYLDIAADAGFTSFLSGFENKDVGNVITFTVTSINYNTNYYYRVRAYNSGGVSSNSNPINVFIPVSIEDNELPDNYYLYQNYPNPFNPSTIIKFNLKKSSFISIIVYDVSGREIETLAKGEFQSGLHSVTFNAAAKLANGIYFYRIITNEFSDIKKMILLK